MYGSTMPITLTQLEDKVIAAAEKDRPGDIKGIVRATSFVMGALTQQYATLHHGYATQYDRSDCVSDYIHDEDDIDLAAFYELAYLARRIDSMGNFDESGARLVKTAVRMVIDGVPLHVAISLVTQGNVAEVEYAGDDLASYWSPTNNFRFGEAFPPGAEWRLAFMSDDSAREMFSIHEFTDDQMFNHVPRGDVINVLTVLGRDVSIHRLVSENESVLQAQRELVLSDDFNPQFLRVLMSNPAFMNRFAFDDEILRLFIDHSQDVFFAVNLHAGIALLMQSSSLSDPARAGAVNRLMRGSGEAINTRVAKEIFDAAGEDYVRIASALYWSTALDAEARALLFLKMGAYSHSIASFVSVTNDDEYRSRFENEDVARVLRGDYDDEEYTSDDRDMLGSLPSIAQSVKDANACRHAMYEMLARAEDIVANFAGDKLYELSKVSDECVYQEVGEDAEALRRHSLEPDASTLRELFERRLDEIN